MGHATSLRVIAQCLDAARVSVFEVAQDGQNYWLTVQSVSHAGEWILRNAVGDNALAHSTARATDKRHFCFHPADISRLDTEAQKQRTSGSSATQHGSKNLPQALRALGDHLDIADAANFRLYWRYDDALVEYEDRSGHRDSRTFTLEKLERLGFHSRFRRLGASRYSFPTGKNLQSSGKVYTPEFPNWSPATSKRRWNLLRAFKPKKRGE